MLSKRIIPCLDIHNGKTVKGINFEGIREVGDPLELARKYADSGADELVFLDISATNENRKTLVTLVEQIAANISIPFTVGGGVRTVEDGYELLQSGADKISVNSAAINRPELITELAARFGSQCIVAAIDAKQENGTWKVTKNGGKIFTELELFSWSETVVQLGAGEILFTSMNQDGTRNGFALEALDQLSKRVNVPIIASGGAGSAQHFIDLFQQTGSDGGLAASIFHDNILSIPELKQLLKNNQINIR